MESGGVITFVCDTDDCKSTVTIAGKKELEDTDDALTRRGWSVVFLESGTKHYCPMCSAKLARTP